MNAKSTSLLIVVTLLLLTGFHSATEEASATEEPAVKEDPQTEWFLERRAEWKPETLRMWCAWDFGQKHSSQDDAEYSA